MFHDIKLKCAGADQSAFDEEEGGQEVQEGTPFTDIATNRFQKVGDEYVSNMTVTDKEIKETETLTRGQNKNQFWFDKRKSVLTASNFGKAAKTKVEPTNKLKAMLYSNSTNEDIQYGIESEAKAVDLYIKEMEKEGINVKVEEVGLLLSKDKTFLGASLNRIVTKVPIQQSRHESWRCLQN